MKLKEILEEDGSLPRSSQATGSDASSFERKVLRSRSVGCGSRSFSSDFFERISTGFGDCTLRRVESQREGKSKSNNNGGGASSSNMKERVKCGGIFERRIRSERRGPHMRGQRPIHCHLLTVEVVAAVGRWRLTTTSFQRREEGPNLFEVYISDGDYGYECISTIQVIKIQWFTNCVIIRWCLIEDDNDELRWVFLFDMMSGGKKI
ncbi:hypothetical protein Ddye_000566 [Dipteronia dyeriana]|uniref:Uncharacterized protein n=1 Tax=Dipteronia dyeriana TaxID=168575 RepID=A0AAE0CSN4_9ROSI|nr:hypothetical protein Ddye_000566 [Dipteronia dyeriana]